MTVMMVKVVGNTIYLLVLQSRHIDLQVGEYFISNDDDDVDDYNHDKDNCDDRYDDRD